MFLIISAKITGLTVSLRFRMSFLNFPRYHRSSRWPPVTKKANLDLGIGKDGAFRTAAMEFHFKIVETAVRARCLFRLLASGATDRLAILNRALARHNCQRMSDPLSLGGAGWS